MFLIAISMMQDIVLLHPETAHEGGPNLSSNIRSMIYFRLRSTTLHSQISAKEKREVPKSINADIVDSSNANASPDDLFDGDMVGSAYIEDYLTNMWIDFIGLEN